MSFLEIFVANFKGKKLGIFQTILLVLLSAALFLALVFVFSPGSTKIAKSNPATIKVGFGDVTSSISQAGSVVSQGVVYVSPKVQERINAIFVKVGDRVSAGALLATLDNTTEIAALTQAKVTLNLDVIQLNNDLANVQALQDTAATNSLAYQSAVDTALSNLKSTKDEMPIKNNNYQNIVDQAQITFNQAQSIYNSYLQLYGATGISLQMCQTYNTVNANCTQLMQDYVNYQNSQIALQTAKQNQTLNQQGDDIQIANLSATYHSAVLQQSAGLLKDQQAINASQRAYATLATQYGISVPNPKPTDFVLPQLAIANAQLALDATYVKAPASGEITEIGAQIGQIAPNGGYNSNGKIDDMFVISAASYQMQSNFNLVDGPKVRLGQIATITFTGLLNPMRPARVVSIAPLVANLNTPPAVQVTFEVTGQHNDIYPGLLGTASVAIRGAHHALIVPNIAIIERAGVSYATKLVLVAGETTYVQVPVVLGVVGNSSSQVLHGLVVGDTIQLQPHSTVGK